MPDQPPPADQPGGWPPQPPEGPSQRPDLRPPAWRGAGPQPPPPAMWTPQQPPQGWPPQQPPGTPPPFMDGGDGAPSLVRPMVLVFALLLAATVIAAVMMRELVAGNSAEQAQTQQQPAGSGSAGSSAGTEVDQRVRTKGAQRIVTGTREQRGTMTLVFPRSVGRWESLPFLIKGVSTPAPQQSGSAWITIYLAHKPCPARRPDPSDKEAHQGPTFMVYADGRFQGAGNYSLREVYETRLNVCGYFGENSRKPPVPGPELVVATSVDLRDQPRAPLPPNFGYLKPGTYRASGSAVRGGGPDAEVTFKVVDTGVPQEARTMLEAEVSGLEPKECGAEGARLVPSKRVYINQLRVTDTFDAVVPTQGFGLTGGTTDGEKARGQAYLDYGQCTATIRFVATRD